MPERRRPAWRGFEHTPFDAEGVAKVAWPIWMYVSVTGVMIYTLLYHLNPVPL